jgi:hypothetical protein
MSWKSLEQVYLDESAKKVLGKLPRQQVLGEDVALYTKKGDDYELIASVDQKYYDDILTRYMQMGSTDSIEGRKNIEDRLEKADGNINDNLNIFQSYTNAARIGLDDEKFNKSQENLVNLCNNNAFFRLDEFINSSFPDSEVYNNFFAKAWCATPNAPTHGAPGCGELFLALFTNGVKPKKGDLSTGGLEIELKGPSGRLLKTERLSNDFTDLQKPSDDNEEILANICKFIANYCGVSDSSNELLKTVKDHNLSELLFQERNYFIEKGKLRPGMGKLGENIILKLGGIIQLFEYKQKQGFDIFLAFNQKGDDLILQAVNMSNLSSLSNFYGQVLKLQGRLKFGRNRDGVGWDCTLIG